MAESAQPAPAVRRMDPQKWARRFRRYTIVFAIVVLVAGFAVFGTRWVPVNMDTVPDVPPGSYCILDKRQSAAQVGSNVFVELPDGELILSRIATRSDDTITLLHPNQASFIPDSRVFGALPHRAIVGTVICVFPPDSGNGSRGGK